MKKAIQSLLVGIGCTFTTLCFSQQSFNSCSAAFLDQKMVVNQYTTTGKCLLPVTAKGQLTVQTVELSPAKSKAIDKIDFKVAIRDKATQTLVSYSDKVFRQLDVQRVLAKCKKGDYIVLLTVNKQYALPHNEILVQ